jgi:hypothetical protein
LRGRDHFEDLGIKEDTIRKDLKITEYEDLDCIHLPQDNV